MRGRLAVACGGVAVLLACQFNSSGGGGDPDLGDTSSGGGNDDDPPVSTSAPSSSSTTTTTTGSTTETTTSSTTLSTGDPSETSSPPTGSTADPSTSGGTAGSSETTTGAECVEPFADLLWVQPRNVDSMQYTESGILPDYNDQPVFYAVSTTALSGTAQFPFDAPCTGEYHVFGLVYDPQGGANNGPDAYYYAMDGEPTGASPEWIYGCQTQQGGWGWHKVEEHVGSNCMTEPYSVDLEVGPHTFTVLNSENGGGGGGFAAIAAIVVTTDADFDPETLYDPSS